MKRIFICLVLSIIGMLTLSINAYAAFSKTNTTVTNSTNSTSKYTIKIPSEYRKVNEGQYNKENGDNINIKVNSFSGDESNVFTNERLEQLVSEYTTNFDKYKEEARKSLKEKYGNQMSDELINSSLQSYKIASIDKKEITRATNNNYKCFHISFTSSLDGNDKIYQDQYMFISNKNSYLLTITVGEKSRLQSTEIKNMIDSFTIYNYKDPENASFISDEALSKIIVGAVFVLGGTILGAISRKKSQKAAQTNYTPYEGEWNELDKSKETDKDNKTNENVTTVEKSENVVTEENRVDTKKYCTKCGKLVESDWTFCNYCGNKLK